MMVSVPVPSLSAAVEDKGYQNHLQICLICSCTTEAFTTAIFTFAQMIDSSVGITGRFFGQVTVREEVG